MRTKTEWTINLDNYGKSSAPTRVGFAPKQGKGIEYKYDMLMEISPEHTINMIKDRMGKFQNRLIQDPDEAFGMEIMEWLNKGEPDKILKTKQDLIEFAASIGLPPKDIADALLKQKPNLTRIQPGGQKSPMQLRHMVNIYKGKKRAERKNFPSRAIDHLDVGKKTMRCF
jgi:hypothetical protein